MQIKYTLDNGAYAPAKAHEWDAGLDLRLPDTYVDGVKLRMKDMQIIDTGVHVAIPQGYVGFVKSKSGLNVKASITSDSGVIDAGYTGSIVAKLYRDDNNGDMYSFYPGDKIVQLVILPIPDVEMIQVESLEKTERGNNGFGSSGR